MFNFFHIKEKHGVIVSPTIVIFALFSLLFIYFLYQIRAIILLLFLSFIIMIALNSAVQKIENRYKLNRTISIVIVYVLVILILISLFAFLIPPLASQLYQLLKTVNLPIVEEPFTDLKFTAMELSDLAGKFGNSLGALFSIISSTFAGIFTFFTLIIMSFYMILDRPKLHLKLYWFTKNAKIVHIAKEFINSVEVQLGGWLRGQIILMSIIGAITYLGLFLLGIPYALPLAILAALLEILPNLGPTIAAIPAIAISFFYHSPAKAVAVIIFYIIVQQVENNVIVPKIIKENADVNPLISLTCILIGFKIYAVLGAFLAVPIYILIRTSYSFWRKYQKDLSPEW